MDRRTVVLLDVMDTLVYNPFHREVPAFFGLSLAHLLQQKDPSAWERFELGQISEQDYFDRYFLDRRRFDYDGLRQTIEAAYRWIDPAIVTLLERLVETGTEIHALSNYPIWYQTIEARLGLSKYLQWTFVSCRTGARKPAAAAYLGAARQLGRPPESLLFVDDSLVNCQAARAVGMRAIHFRNAAALCTDLETFGVLSNSEAE